MYFDPDTIAILRTTLDSAWAGLPPTRRALTSQSLLAERILRAAARGERDPDRLRAHTRSLNRLILKSRVDARLPVIPIVLNDVDDLGPPPLARGNILPETGEPPTVSATGERIFPQLE